MQKHLGLPHPICSAIWAIVLYLQADPRPLAADSKTLPDAASLLPVSAVHSAGFHAIDEADLRPWIYFLASPELQGRNSGEHGFDVAARFCATILERYGVEPAGDFTAGGRSFFQDFNLVQYERGAEALYLELDGGAAKVRLDRALGMHCSSSLETDWQGPWALVDLSHGAAGKTVPERLRDAGLENHAAIVVTDGNELKLSELGLKSEDGPPHLVVHDGQARGAQPPMITRELLEFRAPKPEFRGKGERCVIISNAAADAVLSPYGLSVELIHALKNQAPLPIEELAGLKLRVVYKHARRLKKTRNVAGIIRGADAMLRDEFVAIGAHLDHVGRHEDKIYFGADDNASGTSGVLAMAKAFAANHQKPRRSILLLLFGAEEKGLLGSDYFVEHPAVPMDRIIAYLNLDMTGRDEDKGEGDTAEDNRNSVHLVGSRRLSTPFHELVLSSNQHIGLEFEFDQEDVFTRSDQLHFSRKGVPVAFLFTGFHKDYHQATDTPDKINFPKMARIFRLAYLILHLAADLDERPPLIRRQKF